MNYNDDELIKNGNIDFDYSLKWLHSLKDIYDISDVLKDRRDIWLIFNVYGCDENLMREKFQELISKYFFYVGIINLAMNWNSSSNSKINVKEQLLMFYDYLPLLGLMKFGVTKAFENKIEKKMLTCIK